MVSCRLLYISDCSHSILDILDKFVHVNTIHILFRYSGWYQCNWIHIRMDAVYIWMEKICFPYPILSSRCAWRETQVSHEGLLVAMNAYNLYILFIIDRGSGEIIRLVASVCLFVCLSVCPTSLSCLSKSVLNGWALKTVLVSTGCALAVDHAFNVYCFLLLWRKP